MRLLIILFAIVLLMIIGGWLVVDFRKDATTIEIRTDKMKQDASEAVEQASDRLNRVGEKIDHPE